MAVLIKTGSFALLLIHADNRSCVPGGAREKTAATGKLRGKREAASNATLKPRALL